MKIVKKIQLKIIIFTAVKNRYMLHGDVFVMRSTHSTYEGILMWQSSYMDMQVWENRSSGFPTRSDTNQAVLPQEMARGLKFRIKEEEVLYVLSV